MPVAVGKAGSVANVRETVTKTNSLVDRLKTIELSAVNDVADIGIDIGRRAVGPVREELAHADLLTVAVHVYESHKKLELTYF